MFKIGRRRKEPCGVNIMRHPENQERDQQTNGVEHENQGTDPGDDRKPGPGDEPSGENTTNIGREGFETADLDSREEDPEGTDEESDTWEQGEGGEEDEHMPDLGDLLPPTDVPSLSGLFISMLANSAWQFMGLIPDPKTKQIVTDLKQAGQAIDIIEFVHTTLGNDMGRDMASGIEDLLANLRINYVKKSGMESEKAE